MKPKCSSRIFCIVCKKPKLLFASEQKADNLRSYYCRACGGWHVTSSPKRRLIRKKKQALKCAEPRQVETVYEWRVHRKVVAETIGKVWTAFLLYKYDVFYELIEQAYIEVEKAEEHGVSEEELHEYREKLRISSGGVRKACPRGSQRLNEAFEWLDFEVFRMKATIPLTEDGYKAYQEQASKIKDGISRALHFGGRAKMLKKYERALEHWLHRYNNNVFGKEYLIEYRYIHPSEKEIYKRYYELLLLEQGKQTKSN